MHSRPQKAQKLRSIHHLYFLHLINFVPLLSFRLCTIPRPFFPSFLHRPDHRYLKRRQQLVQEEQRDGLTEGQRVVRYLRYNFLLNFSAVSKDSAVVVYSVRTYCTSSTIVGVSVTTTVVATRISFCVSNGWRFIAVWPRIALIGNLEMKGLRLGSAGWSLGSLSNHGVYYANTHRFERPLKYLTGYVRIHKKTHSLFTQTGRFIRLLGMAATMSGTWSPVEQPPVALNRILLAHDRFSLSTIIASTLFAMCSDAMSLPLDIQQFLWC